MILHIFLVICVTWLIIRIKKGYSKYCKLIEHEDYVPYNIPILGILSHFLTLAHLGYDGLEIPKQFIKTLKSPFYESGIAIFWGGNFLYPKVIATTSRIEVIKAVLNNKNLVEKGDFYYFLEDVLGHGLVTAPKSKWSKNRKRLNPLFHLIKLRNFVPIMSTHAQQLVDSWKNRFSNNDNNIIVDNLTHDIANEIMGTLLETLIGVQDENNLQEWRDKGEILDSIHFNRLFNPIFLIPYFYYMTQEGKFFYDSIGRIRISVKKYILEKIDDKKNNNNQNFDIVKIVDVLICEHMKNPEEVTMEYMTDELITFIGAGWDTTTWATTFVFQLLGSYPEVQEKVIQEIDSKLSNVQDDHLLTIEDISELTYLECVIKETLRYISLASVSTRTIDFDLEYEMDGRQKTIPAGTELFLDLDMIHRNPRYWKNPDKFDPDRFLPENSKHRDPLTFIPFNHGPRNCIGRTFAMYEMKVFLTHILRNFKVTALDILDMKQLIASGIVRRTKKPLKFNFELRR